MEKTKQEKNVEESFETVLERLRLIVRGLEMGDTPLEESLKKFEEGMRLAKVCQDRLTQAEQKIEILVKADKSEIVTRPFQGE